MKNIAAISFAVAILLALSCSKHDLVDPTNCPGDLHLASYIAIDPDGHLLQVTIEDSIASSGGSLVVYRESGVSFDWELEVVFSRTPWQAMSFTLESPVRTADISWGGSRVSGTNWDSEGGSRNIDKNVDSFSIHAWFVWAAFFGMPWTETGWAVDFDMITPDLDVYAYRGVFEGEGTVSSARDGELMECYKLHIDGRGLIGLFAPDINLYVRKEPPHIPLYCTVEGEGAVYRFFADSL
ncbi:MAG TPA: hypothetical protein ENN07_02645 [candidate division Zixibacteria bacterium]|nr:hypothetical protein [candidate division Zixibacteria bacterium]